MLVVDMEKLVPMKNIKILMLFMLFLSIVACTGNSAVKSHEKDDKGIVLDRYNGIPVYENARITGKRRHIAPDGYNYGLKWQCVEFVKRYYHDRLHHRMPDGWGNAKDFFDRHVPDGGLNKRRNLLQFTNGSKSKPQVDDIMVFDFGPYGHVAIVSKVDANRLEVVQQNMGRNTRASYRIYEKNGKWYVDNDDVLGWLRKR